MVISGIIEEIIFRNNENNYTVLNLTSNGENIVAVGKFPPVSEGEQVELNGSFTKHSKYGEQFAVTSVKLTPPNTLDGIVRYLSSGLIKGVGPITALNIVSKFKKDTLEIIEFNPQRLTEVKGISTKKADEICKSFSQIKQMQNAVIYLQAHNISTNMAIKIFNVYGDQTENVLKTNPYKLVEDIDGVGFFTADKIAQNLGIKSDSEFRFRAGIMHALKENSEKSGNTYITKSNLIDNVYTLLGIKTLDNEDIINKILLALQYSNQIKILDDEKIMLTKYFMLEKSVAIMLTLLNDFEKNDIDLSAEIKLFEDFNHIKMHDNQKEAVSTAINNGVSIITGGPGTGKTTIVKCILQLFNNMRKNVLLLAPTGRASKRLSESTGKEAQTIHRALELDFTSSNMFNYNNMNKLPHDVIIVDEVSMVDIQLFYYLLRAIRKGAHLILVGDKDQLASVGAGNVLADLLDSNKIATVCLTQIYRQSENSLIITNAHAINNGKMPIINNKSNDFFFLEKEDNESVLKSVIEMCTSRISNFLKTDNSKIQVLAPMKAGVCGIDNMNKSLQDKLNPPSLKKAELVFDKYIYRVGDRVMQITNNYERTWNKGYKEQGTGVFNGDIGVIDLIDINTGEVIVEFEDGRRVSYLKSDLNELTLSYAITIHKSQGSEFDVVVLPLLSGPPMLLTRNLLYTAVTRAKKMVVIIGTKMCVRRMVSNNHTQTRYTMLKELLQNENLALV